MTDLADLTAVDLARAFEAGDCSPAEALRAVRARIEAWEPTINALWHRDDDEADAAGARGRRSLARRGAAQPAGRRAGDDQGEHRHRRRGHRPWVGGERAGAGAARRPRGRAAQGGRRGAGGQDHDARLRHAHLGRVDHARDDAQPLEPRLEPRRLELGRGGGHRRRLRPDQPRHRHRRVGATARRLHRRRRPQGELRARPRQPAVLRARRRAADPDRRRRRAGHGRPLPA